MAKQWESRGSLMGPPAPIRAHAFGSFTISVAAGGSGTGSVTFPAGRFSSTPHINLTVGNARLTPSITAASLSPTGFTYVINNWTSGSTGTTPVYWHAVETSDAPSTGDPRYAVRTQAELAAALQLGGHIIVDSNSPITLDAQMNVTVAGTRISGGRFTRTSGTAFYITASDVEIDGARITGGGTGSGYEAAQKLILAQGTSATPLSNIRIRDCHLTGSRADNVRLEWCVDSKVADCTISKFLYSGIMIISGKRVLVTGNSVSDSPMIAPVVNVYGIAVTDLDNTAAARSVDCTITGNQVHLIDWEAIDTHGGDGMVVTGNTVTASPRGIALVTGNETRLMAPVRCTVSGNSIDGRNARQTLREAIHLGGIAGTPADATVTGNHITNYGTPYFLNYVDRAKTYIGGNNVPLVPWTNITLDGDYNANATYTPQYMVDGNTVSLRGGVIPKTSTSDRETIGSLPSPYAWPSSLTFVNYVKGSNAAAGNGMVSVNESGVVGFAYYSGTDTYTYFLHGTYEAV